MSKSAATTDRSCRTHSAWVCAALTALATLAPLPAAAGAAAVEPVLRRSEQIDSRRLGTVAADERAVLQLEWRATQSGGEEAQRVQEMLDSLRRMESTVGEIGRLMRGIPAPKAAVAAAAAEAAEAPESDAHGWRLALANATAAALVALWWFRRRQTAKAAAAADTAPKAGPVPVPPAHPAPQTSPLPVPEASPGPAPETRPPRASPLAPLPAMTPESPAAPPPAAARAETPPEPDSARVDIELEAEPAQAEPAPPAAAPADEIPPIEFVLEDADPEAVARANARVPAPAPALPRAPRKAQESNVEPTLELAEIMLSMGLAQGAAQALVEYSEANPRQALYHWLKLLDIYRTSGHRKDFTETAEKLRQHFNIQAEDWARSGTGAQPALENFSRVAQHVQQLWSQPAECIAYLRHLLEDNREGSRAGFPQPVAEEILWLIEILSAPPGDAQAGGT